MNIENELFLTYKDYILNNSKYIPKIYPKAPQSLVDFPTIVMKEYTNIDDMRYKTTNRQEYANRVSYRIEIYSKNKVIDGKTINSKVILDELKYLTFNFFNTYGFERTMCDYAEYLDVTVDRLIIIEKGLVNNWNKQISS